MHVAKWKLKGYFFSHKSWSFPQKQTFCKKSKIGQFLEDKAKNAISGRHRGGFSGLVVTGVWGPSLESHTHLQGWFLGKVVPMARDFLQKVDPCLGISRAQIRLLSPVVYSQWVSMLLYGLTFSLNQQTRY